MTDAEKMALNPEQQANLERVATYLRNKYLNHYLKEVHPEESSKDDATQLLRWMGEDVVLRVKGKRTCADEDGALQQYEYQTFIPLLRGLR